MREKNQEIMITEYNMSDSSRDIPVKIIRSRRRSIGLGELQREGKSQL